RLSERPDGAIEEFRCARVCLLHQPPLPQGQIDQENTAGGADLSLGAFGKAGADPGKNPNRLQSRGGCLLANASAPDATGSPGLPTKRNSLQPRRFARGSRPARAPISGPVRPATAILDRGAHPPPQD